MFNSQKDGPKTYLVSKAKQVNVQTIDFVFLHIGAATHRKYGSPLNPGGHTHDGR